eukprot:364983-Chlamydomonas_euryale.AAC.11
MVPGWRRTLRPQTLVGTAKQLMFAEGRVGLGGRSPRGGTWLLQHCARCSLSGWLGWGDFTGGAGPLRLALSVCDVVPTAALSPIA